MRFIVQKPLQLPFDLSPSVLKGKKGIVKPNSLDSMLCSLLTTPVFEM